MSCTAGVWTKMATRFLAPQSEDQQYAYLKQNLADVQNHGKDKMGSVITVVTCVAKTLIVLEMTDAVSMDAKMTVWHQWVSNFARSTRMHRCPVTNVL